MPDSVPRRILAAHTLLLALLCSLPHWVALVENQGDYLPFSVSPAVSALVFDETHAYAPPARRFMHFGRIPAEVDNFERRNLSAGIPFIPAGILGAMGRALGSLEWAFIAADFVFPALLFLLYYALGRSLLVAWSSIIIPFGLLNSVWLGQDAFLAPLEITRTPQPEISFPVLIIAAILLAKALRENSSRLWVIGAGIASGAVVYCYYYYAVAWGITLGLFFLFGLIWRWQFVWQRAIVVIALMAVISIPFGLATAKGRTQGGQTDLLARMGAFTHQPDFPALFAALALSFVLVFYAREFFRRQPAYFVLALLVAAAFYGMNFQVLAGFETQPWHFWKRLALPVTFFLLAAFAAQYFRPREAKRLARALLILLIASTTARLTIAALRTAPHQRASNPKFEVLAWARSHIAPNQVIGTTEPELILLIPALTTDYTYVPSGLRSLTPTREIIARYDQLACLIGLSPEDVASAAAIPNHLGHSTELMQVLGLTFTGDPAVEHAFIQQYASFSRHCTPPRSKLDILILSIKSNQTYPAGRTIYSNSEYRLLALH